MQTEAKTLRVQAPISWAARRLLSADDSVQAVMVVGEDGKVLAHERALDYTDGDPLKGEGHSLFYYAPRTKLLFFIRLNRRLDNGKISGLIRGVIDSPSFAISR